MKGQIIKALSGFYYVETKEGTLYQTRGRGNFRKKGQTPLVGDEVLFESTNQKEGYILQLEPRKNQMVRPPVANVDTGVIVMSAVDPEFSFQLLDRFLVHLEHLKIHGAIYLTKLDLVEDLAFFEEVKANYEKIGYQVFLGNQEKVPAGFKELFKDHLTVFMGQSGAGKSTLLNELAPHLSLETGEISKSLGRGRHTTRHVELHPLFEGLIADTPGFSSLDFPYEMTEVTLPYLFPEFVKASQNCKFRQCAHLDEPGCGVKSLVESGEILESRYENYLQFLKEIKNRKVIYRKKKV